MRLKPEIIDQIKSSNQLKAELIAKLDYNPNGMESIIRLNKHEGILTTFKALCIVSKFLGIPVNNLIEQ